MTASQPSRPAGHAVEKEICFLFAASRAMLIQALPGHALVNYLVS